MNNIDEELVLAHFIVSDDVERSLRFYTEVLGGRLVFSGPGRVTYVALSDSWIIINGGGGPTDDKPSVTLETRRDPDRVSSFLNVREGDQTHRQRASAWATPRSSRSPDDWLPRMRSRAELALLPCRDAPPGPLVAGPAWRRKGSRRPRALPRPTRWARC